LGADVNLNNTANFFNGPNTGSIGASGRTAIITGVASVLDTASGANIEVAIFDGSTYIANTRVVTAGASFTSVVTIVAAVSLTGAMTFTLRVRDQTSINGLLMTTANSSGVANRASSITVLLLP